MILFAINPIARQKVVASNRDLNKDLRRPDGSRIKFLEEITFPNVCLFVIDLISLFEARHCSQFGMNRLTEYNQAKDFLLDEVSSVSPEMTMETRKAIDRYITQDLKNKDEYDDHFHPSEVFNTPVVNLALTEAFANFKTAADNLLRPIPTLFFTQDPRENPKQVESWKLNYGFKKSNDSYEVQGKYVWRKK